MIDNRFTQVQERIIQATDKFVYRSAGPFSGIRGSNSLRGIENRIAMTVAIVITSLVDHIKIPLSVLEYSIKTINSLLRLPLHRKIDKVIQNLTLTYTYLNIFVSKYTLGLIHDLHVLPRAFLTPHHIPFYVPPSYYGSGRLYKKFEGHPDKHPSIYSP